MTGLKRKTVIEILSRVESSVFQQFQESPEEFIAQAERLILNVKETAISENIIYHTSDEKYTKDIFTQQTIQGKQGVDAMKVGKHLYDYVKYRSGAEKEFIERLEASKEVAVYVKLPEQFYISTPADVICRNGRSLCTGKRKENVSLLLEKSRKKIKTLISQK